VTFYPILERGALGPRCIFLHKITLSPSASIHNLGANPGNEGRFFACLSIAAPSHRRTTMGVPTLRNPLFRFTALCFALLVLASVAIPLPAQAPPAASGPRVVVVRSLSRSMGTAWWTSGPLKTPSQYSACRLEVPGKSYGFFAYEEDPKLAGTPAENRVTKQEMSAKTKEMFELIYRLWAQSLEPRQHPRQAAN
jgi:hypothetical protein